jgi:hypothetical protein
VVSAGEWAAALDIVNKGVMSDIAVIWWVSLTNGIDHWGYNSDKRVSFIGYAARD